MENSTQREANRQKFLKEFFKNSEISINPIQGDAGLRDYFRVNSPNNSFILMDCPPSYTSIKPFLEVANYLSSIDLRAPKVYKANEDDGFILLEDFGNQSAADYLSNTTHYDQKLAFYKLTIDILCKLQKNIPAASLPTYTNQLLLSELDLFLEWYVPHTNDKKLSENETNEFRNIWGSILNNRPDFENTTVLRDYHVQNMMILSNDLNIDAIGLLDFQDALIGSPIYDLVSILEDARLRVPQNLAIEIIKYYAIKTGSDYDNIMLEYSILGAQRNMRILGVFARKAMRDKAKSYLNFIPTVLEYINYDLSHPALSELANWVDHNIKQPAYQN